MYPVVMSSCELNRPGVAALQATSTTRIDDDVRVRGEMYGQNTRRR